MTSRASSLLLKLLGVTQGLACAMIPPPASTPASTPASPPQRASSPSDQVLPARSLGIRVLHSSDQGSSWEETSRGLTHDIAGYYIYGVWRSKKEIFAVGEEGAILCSLD